MFDQHLEAEQAVLGSMLIDADCIDGVMEQLRSDDFALQQNRDIFSTIRTMHQSARSIDGVTIAAEMERNDTYDPVTTRTYLAELMEVTPTSANVMEYADIVRDQARRRKLIDALREAGDDVGPVVALCQLSRANEKRESKRPMNAFSLRSCTIRLKLL